MRLLQQKNKEILVNNFDNNEPSLPKEKKRFTIFGVEVVYLYFFGIGVAFLGWIVENAFKFFVSGWFDSRFHFLPFISPYASLPLAFHIALGSPDDVCLFGWKIFKVRTRKTVILSNILTYFLMSLFVFLGELAVGNLWDVLFDVQLWNYHNLPLNVTQYTSIATTLGFGLFAYVIFKFIYKPILAFLRKKVNYNVAKWICLTLGIAIILDTVRMIISMAIIGEAPNFWTYWNGKFYWEYGEYKIKK